MSISKSFLCCYAFMFSNMFPATSDVSENVGLESILLSALVTAFLCLNSRECWREGGIAVGYWLIFCVVSLHNHSLSKNTSWLLYIYVLSISSKK